MPKCKCGSLVRLMFQLYCCYWVINGIIFFPLTDRVISHWMVPLPTSAAFNWSKAFWIGGILLEGQMKSGRLHQRCIFNDLVWFWHRKGCRGWNEASACSLIYSRSCLLWAQTNRWVKKWHEPHHLRQNTGQKHKLEKRLESTDQAIIKNPSVIPGSYIIYSTMYN